jgi:hypothetical protein
MVSYLRTCGSISDQAFGETGNGSGVSHSSQASLAEQTYVVWALLRRL